MRVEILSIGYLIRDLATGLPIEASSTVTLAGDKVIIDTGSRSKRREIEEGLRTRLGLGVGVISADISAILHTHDHIDHIENDDLFPNAQVLELREGNLDIDGLEFEVMPTPGHTPDSVSIFMIGDDGNLYGAVGDAIPTEDNFKKWIPPFVSYDREEALRSMEKVVSKADVIIPGHGNLFTNPRKAVR
jgi:glyoxylase-like metal-dependent hydrolase (beta-lactamase superfamily II)